MLTRVPSMSLKALPAARQRLSVGETVPPASQEGMVLQVPSASLTFTKNERKR